MRNLDNAIQLSASDLANHLACKHLTSLELSALEGLLEKPHHADPLLALLQERGQQFEREQLEQFREQQLSIEDNFDGSNDAGLSRTIRSMLSGYDVIYQATLSHERWAGRADFLRKVDSPSKLGNWSYEVMDTKLAQETRAGTILQLCLYSQIIAEIQGVTPAYMHVISPEEEMSVRSFRVADYMAYFRLIQRQLIEQVDRVSRDKITYPHPTAHCDICSWWRHCDGQRRQDDHLSLVAGLAGTHRKELSRWSVDTLEGLGGLTLPLPFKPSRGAAETFVKLREQARVQLESRLSQAPVYELFAPDPGQGVSRLPEPSAGDVFFDLESDPFAGEHGLEYLFGWQFNDESEDAYHRIWAFDPAMEKETFEKFVAMVMQRWTNYPEMHIYHFSPYEPVAIKRLMGKYNTCEDEIDRMLRAGLFIDLHSIVKQSLRAGIENYSLKELEIFHTFSRAIELRTASQELRTVEYFLEREDAAGIPPETITAVEAYNREDCLSTRRLRNWLEQLRSQLIDRGAFIVRPVLAAGDPSEALTAHQEMIANLFRQLTHDLSIIREERNDEQQGVWLLANMLDWYRRENKAGWWEYFRMKELPDDELLEEKTAISGLLFTGNRQTVKKSVIDTYTFPLQECEIRVKDKLKTGDGGSFGEVESIDLLHNTVAIKKGPSILDTHPNSVFKFEMYLDRDKQDAITRLAQWIAQYGIDHPDTMYRAARDLLLRHSPRTLGEVPLGTDQRQGAIEWSAQLDHSYLAIQGPPGAGKSYTAAQMILSLIAQGYTIGITALSHKVIRGLLDKVLTVACEKGIEIRCIQKVSNPSDTLPRGLTETTGADDVPGAIGSGQFMIAAGTSWLWSKQSLENSVDYLFVDEAGQFSLIDTLAVSQAAKNLVLLGDPQQLKQPQQGTHPEGTELSALEHLLNGSQTIPDNKGIFLSETWRLHPTICTFISELFYNSRLYPKQGLEQQAVIHDGPFSGSGLFFQPVEHEGNQSSSTEEVSVIKQLVNNLKNKAVWINAKAESQPLTAKDIMIIAPYNAQVAKLTEAMPDLPIGTVDKFQGQEAPVVIFSLSSSSPEDAPRGMDFLYSLNRLNVAVSRARAMVIVVGNPSLFTPDCKNPAQIRLANAFCRYLELAVR